jgi:hypothetical protein
LLNEEAVVVVVVAAVVLVEVTVVAAPVSDDVSVPLQGSMFLHHCIVSDPTLQKYRYW